MPALSSLHQDHRTLLALTDALDGFALAIIRDDELGPREVGTFAQAFREFADYVHYEKEEQVLLPFLVRRGFDWNDELFEQVRADHVRERYLIEVLHHGAEREGGLSAEDRRRLASTAATLACVQRSLTMKQDIELFPEVLSQLDSEALTELHAELSAFDLHTGAAAAQLRQLIAGLAQRYSS